MLVPDWAERLEEHAETYASAHPFPHLVIDNLFDTQALKQVLQEWPNAESVTDFDDGKFVLKKYASTWKTELGRVTQDILHQLNGPQFLNVLSKVTGIRGLISDPYLQGGGLHFTRAGGKLAVHTDFNTHPLFKLDRRLNLLVFLNEDWGDDNQGWLELWDREMSACQKRILPVMNRTVIFSTTDYSYHGQPEPVLGPPELTRYSIATYYYSNGRPDEETSGESLTNWRERPGKGY